MYLESIIAAIATTKMLNGKLKPQYDKKKAIFAFICFALLFILAIAMVVYEIYTYKTVTLELLLCLLAIYSIIYLFLISPYTQNANNYYIEFSSNDSLDNFILKYKGKVVDVKYVIDNEGKIAFEKNLKKTDCISYADGSKMNKFTKHRIANYFSFWLNSNNLLSSSVTFSLE